MIESIFQALFIIATFMPAIGLATYGFHHLLGSGRRSAWQARVIDRELTESGHELLSSVVLPDADGVGMRRLRRVVRCGNGLAVITLGDGREPVIRHLEADLPPRTESTAALADTRPRNVRTGSRVDELDHAIAAVHTAVDGEADVMGYTLPDPAQTSSIQGQANLPNMLDTLGDFARKASGSDDSWARLCRHVRDDGADEQRWMRLGVAVLANLAAIAAFIGAMTFWSLHNF